MSRSMSPAETATSSPDDGAARRPGRASIPSLTRWMRGLVGAAVLFGLVELLTRAGLVSSDYLPPASSILRETIGLFGDGEFRKSLWGTLKACLIGLSLSVLVAVPVGLVLGLSPLVHKATSTILEFLRPIPSVALIPLAILLYGRGTEMKVALAMYACVWPILFNTIYGIRSVDPVASDTARVFGLGKVKTATRVHLRSAAPFVYTGVKIAASIAVILVVSAELLAGGAAAGGIGILMLNASSIGDQSRVYALTIVSGLIGLVLNIGFASVERRLFPWNVQEDEAA
jgi:NitT/TauT family transport system permease protein